MKMDVDEGGLRGWTGTGRKKGEKTGGEQRRLENAGGLMLHFLSSIIPPPSALPSSFEYCERQS